MKRVLAMLLVSVLLFAAGCGQQTASASSQPAPAKTPAAAQEPAAATPAPTPAPTEQPVDYSAYDTAKKAAVSALASRLGESYGAVYVYKDYAVTENHYTQKSKIFGADGSLVRDMDENCKTDPYEGESCIRCEISTAGTDWGGWMFLNGYLPAAETVPRLNTGDAPGQGLDLSGAQELRFWAKGQQGGECVEFFTCGFGYDGEWGNRLVPYPDSAKKQTLGFVTLTAEWAEYVIPLSGLDMSEIVCGFGFVCSGTQGETGKKVFYLDSIRFEGDILSAENARVLLRSYDTENIYIKNAAFSYDNALVAMAFISEGMQTEAAALLDAFVYAVENDRYATGRVRNAYAAGDISAFPGWESGARLPGWYDAADEAYYEDRYQVGSNVGNTSYVALALLQYDAAFGGDKYEKTASRLMDWVIENCTDGSCGFTAGYDGWPEGEAPLVYEFTYKSIEHNIDAYAAFSRLFELTGEEKYRAAAQSALEFIESMYDDESGLFFTGAGDDGVTPSGENIVLDAQVWSALALGEAFEEYADCLKQVEEMEQNGGYPFCKANENGGWWAEGTAYTALMYRLRGEGAKAAGAMDALCSIQLENGLFPAATVDELSTGFYLFTGEPWVYSTDAHIAPAAWFVMAANAFNPYAFQ